MGDRRAVIAWMLYDFANSAFVAVIPATVYSKYYALAVVGNARGEGDFWWGLSVTTSMALVALSAPPMPPDFDELVLFCHTCLLS